MGDHLKVVMTLSELDTLVEPQDLDTLIRFARIAEDTGIDAISFSEHHVMGGACGRDGRPANPRDFALPFNQYPEMPWPSSIPLLSAIAAVTSHIDVHACAILAPLHASPLDIAKELATLDLISNERLTVTAVAGWQSEEYEAMGIPYNERGARLDDHLEAWKLLWSDASPVSFQGRKIQFEDVYFHPKPRSGGPKIWMGMELNHPRALPRIVDHASGIMPGPMDPEDRARIAAAMKEAGRDFSELDLGMPLLSTFPDDGPDCLADLGKTLELVPMLVEAGFSYVGPKPSQYIDSPDDFEGFCKDLVKRLEAIGT